MDDPAPVGFWIICSAISIGAFGYTLRHLKVPLKYMDIDSETHPRLFWIAVIGLCIFLACSLIGLFQALFLQTT